MNVQSVEFCPWWRNKWLQVSSTGNNNHAVSVISGGRELALCQVVLWWKHGSSQFWYVLGLQCEGQAVVPSQWSCLCGWKKMSAKQRYGDMLWFHVRCRECETVMIKTHGFLSVHTRSKAKEFRTNKTNHSIVSVRMRRSLACWVQ